MKEASKYNIRTTEYCGANGVIECKIKGKTNTHPNVTNDRVKMHIVGSVFYRLQRDKTGCYRDILL